VARAPKRDIRAALHDELQRSLALLAQPLTDEAIHEVRQSLKRARAALRLLQDAVSHAAYARENACLRDAAQPLSAARDARVMLGLVDELIRSRKTRPYRPVLLRLRGQLRKTHERRLAAARGKRMLARIRNLLERCLHSTARWRLPHDVQRIYVGGLARIYHQGHSELQAALARRSTATLHEWRKQVKYLGTAITLLALEQSGLGDAQRLAAQAARQLGEEHDLAVLAAALRRMRADGALLGKLEQKRHKLQRRALKRGERLYKQTPDRFAERLRRLGLRTAARRPGAWRPRARAASARGS
jgi:hypothetical protein